MNAYELFCQDVKGDELIRETSDRRRYYLDMRQALKEEVAAGMDSALLTHLMSRLESGSPARMYLLDAAALWECYESVIDGVKFPRDVAQGLPFPVADGRRLPWAEVQRMSDLRTLPVAVVDDELRARLQILTAYVQAGGMLPGTLKKPSVKYWASLRLEDARKAGAIPFGAQPVPGAAMDELSGKICELEEQVRQLQEANDRLQESNRDLKRDLDARRDNGDAALLTELILRNRISEAAAEASRLGVRLDGDIQRLQEAQASITALNGEIERVQAQLRADSDQAQALRAQQRAVEQAAAGARSECVQAQSEAAARQQEKQEAERRLSEARAELSRQNAELRKLQRQRMETDAAAELTRRQVERLS